MAPSARTLRVHGMREFLRASSRAEKESKTEVRGAFHAVGEVVRVEAAHLFDRYDPHTATGFRTRVRQTNVAVEQSQGRTTGKRPDYGVLQMRQALLPALEEKEGEIMHEFDDAIDKVADHFEK